MLERPWFPFVSGLYLIQVIPDLFVCHTLRSSGHLLNGFDKSINNAFAPPNIVNHFNKISNGRRDFSRGMEILRLYAK